jgi:hypothetical protein
MNRSPHKTPPYTTGRFGDEFEPLEPDQIPTGKTAEEIFVLDNERTGDSMFSDAFDQPLING